MTGHTKCMTSSRTTITLIISNNTQISVCFILLLYSIRRSIFNLH